MAAAAAAPPPRPVARSFRGEPPHAPQVEHTSQRQSAVVSPLDAFSHSRHNLPSPQYSFGLVRSALARNAVIVIIRSERLWRAALPELTHPPRCYCLHNPQHVVVTPNNCPDGYGEILAAL